MDKFEFVPYKKAGVIEFGISRENVRKILGNFREYRKTRHSKNTTDDFGCFHIYYDDGNNVEAVEFFSESKLILNEKNLFDMNCASLKKYINDSDIKEENEGFTSKKTGISVFCGDNDKIESILIFKKGYFS